MTFIVDGTNGLTFPNSTVQASAGKVLQVVYGSNSTVASTTSQTYVDTGLSATITPTSSSSKIIILSSFLFAINASGTGCGFRLARGSTAIFDPSPTSATGPYFGYIFTSTSLYTSASINYSDSPATTSATTYKLQYRSFATGQTAYFNGDSGSTVQPGTSNLILMEVAV